MSKAPSATLPNICTLGFLIKVQALINVQGGILAQKNKRAGPNKAVQGGKFGKINKRTIV